MERIKKRDVKTSTSKLHFGDVTLNDFANADLVGKSRIKKVTYGNYDVSYDLVVPPDDELNERKVRHRKKNNSESAGGNCVYPEEIWFLISDYIQPEDVGKFCRICKQSNRVVNTAAFWFNLYKRYYCDEQSMPFRLQPDSFRCLHALKQRVIRALYYMYPPFKSKCLEEEYKMTNPVYNNVVVKRKCVLTWLDQAISTQKISTGTHAELRGGALKLAIELCKCDIIHEGPTNNKKLADLSLRFFHNKKYSLRSNNEVIYSFKLKRMDMVMTKPKSQTFLELLDDISVNEETGCLILEVVANKYIGTPASLGLTLISINYNMKSLELIFSSSVIPNSTSLTTVRFNTVKKLSVFHWWSPQYPHNNSIPFSQDVTSVSEF